MLDQARAEAQSRRDALAQRRFEALDIRHFSAGDAGNCCLYLFGQVYPLFDAKTGDLLEP